VGELVWPKSAKQKFSNEIQETETQTKKKKLTKWKCK